MSLQSFSMLNEVAVLFILKYVHDIVVKSSRSLSHLLMSFLYISLLPTSVDPIQRAWKVDALDVFANEMVAEATHWYGWWVTILVGIRATCPNKCSRLRRVGLREETGEQVHGLHGSGVVYMSVPVTDYGHPM